MWGAKVKMPCDMEDDVLEDAIKHVTSRLAKFDTEEWEKNGLAVSAAVPAAMNCAERQLY
jgi:dynein light chain LC8-type